MACDREQGRGASSLIRAYRLRPATCDGCPTVGEVHDSAGRTCARSRHANNGREGYQLPSCRWVWIGGDRGACTGLVDGLCLCRVRQGGRTCRLVRRNRRPTGDRVFEEEICTASPVRDGHIVANEGRAASGVAVECTIAGIPAEVHCRGGRDI